MSFRCEEIKEFLSYFVRCHHNDFVLFFYSQPPRRKTARNIIRWPSVGTTRKFKIIFSHFRYLADLGSVVQGLGRSDETHLAVTLARHQNHTLGLDAENGTRLQVRENADLLADHLLRSIELGDA